MQFSFIMVDFGSGEDELCQVLSIVRIEGSTRGLDLLMVVQMEECDIPNSTRKYNLPYKTYCYARDPEDRSCCLSCHAISFDCVTGRAFVESCVNTSAFNTVTVANFDSQYYYCIPHNRLGTSQHIFDATAH